MQDSTIPTDDLLKDVVDSLVNLWDCETRILNIQSEFLQTAIRQKADRIRWIFSRLNGRKFLTYGNHDLRHGILHPTIAELPWAARPEGFLFVEDEGGQKVVLSHYGQRSWQWEHKGGWHFYGHAHGNLKGVGRSRDVGVDLPDVQFTPRTFRELTKGMK